MRSSLTARQSKSLANWIFKKVELLGHMPSVSNRRYEAHAITVTVNTDSTGCGRARYRNDSVRQGSEVSFGRLVPESVLPDPQGVARPAGKESDLCAAPITGHRYRQRLRLSLS